MAIVDNAGVFLQRVDKSQSPASLVPDALHCAFAISAERGFINQVYVINDSKTREDVFGKKNFRKYGTSQHDLDKYLEARNPSFVVRAGDDTWANAGMRISIAAAVVTVAAGGVTQAQIGSYTGNELIQIFAMGEGEWGNNIKVTCTANTKDQFVEGDKDRLSVLTIIVNAIVEETWTISPFDGDLDDNGSSLFITDVLKASDWITADVKDGDIEDDLVQLAWTQTTLTGGNTLAVINKAFYFTAIKLILEFPDRYDAFLACNAGYEMDLADFSSALDNNGRVFGLSSANRADALDPSLSANDFVISRAAGHGGNANGEYPANNSFLAIYPQWVLTLDTDASQDIFISSAGYAANVIAAQSNNGQLFFAPAGPIRGNLPGAKNTSRNWEGADRVTLVSGQWNPIRVNTSGIMFWEEVTSQTLQTEFSNIHVGLAFIAFARAIPTTVESFLFEFNDQETVDAIVTRLQDLADRFVDAKAAEEIQVNSNNNVIGSPDILINWEWRPKGVARKIIVRVVAHPATQELSISLAT